MKTKRLITAIILTLLLAALAVPAASASDATLPTQGTRVIPGGSEVVRDGEVANDDFVIFGGSLLVEAEGEIDGDVSVYGGSATIEGTVTGDIYIFGGSIELAETALVEGEIFSAGGHIDQAPGAEVEGGLVTAGDDGRIVFDGNYPPREWNPGEYGRWLGPGFDYTPGDWYNDRYSFGSIAGRSVSAMFNAFALGLFAALLYLFIPTHINRVSRELADQPLASFGIGMGSIAAAIGLVILLVILSITVFLIPITIPGILLVIFGMVLAGLFGWLVIGTVIGQRLLAGHTTTMSPAVAAGLGTFMLTLVLLILCEAWVIGWLFGLALIVVVAMGLGAVLNTRFGTQSGTLLAMSSAGPMTYETAATAPPAGDSLPEDESPVADDLPPVTDDGEPPALEDDQAA